MFEVRISAEAKQAIDRAIARHQEPKVGLMIHRQGPSGDVLRNSNGDAQWQIERPHPWGIQVGAYGNIPDNDENIVVVEGIRVWLPLIPRPGERGVVVLLRNGQLHVEAIAV